MPVPTITEFLEVLKYTNAFGITRTHLYRRYTLPGVRASLPESFLFEDLYQMEPRLRIALPWLLNRYEQCNPALDLTGAAGQSLCFQLGWTFNHWLNTQSFLSKSSKLNSNVVITDLAYQSEHADIARELHVVFDHYTLHHEPNSDEVLVAIVTSAQSKSDCADIAWLHNSFPGWGDRLIVAKALELEGHEKVRYVLSKTSALSACIGVPNMLAG